MNPNTVEVLLIEDDADDAELIIRELKKFHFASNLVHMTDGEAALDFLFGEGEFRANRDVCFLPRLILLDIQMPKMNGLEILAKIKSDTRTRAVPVVMLTSSNQTKDIYQGYQLGANSYVVKAVEFDRFADSMRAVGNYWLLFNQAPFK